MTTPSIEKGIPIPPTAKYRGKWKVVAAEMEVGDSILCEQQQNADALRHAMRSLGFKNAQRKTPEGWRVWRVE